MAGLVLETQLLSPKSQLFGLLSPVTLRATSQGHSLQQTFLSEALEPQNHP